MNHALPTLQANGTHSGAVKAKRSDGMLIELLALNEEMIAQLRLERLSIVGTTDFIAGMIVQHEQVAARLRAQLRRHEAGVSQNLGASRAAVRLPNS
jgi:hypothetical protein